LISASRERSALTYLTALHEMTRFCDEMTNRSSLSLDPLPDERSLRPIGVSFYGEDQSQLTIDHDMSLWGSMLPPLYVPSYVEVDLFVVKMQQTYDCIGTPLPPFPSLPS
jgi:hypothetical protein